MKTILITIFCLLTFCANASLEKDIEKLDVKITQLNKKYYTMYKNNRELGTEIWKLKNDPRNAKKYVKMELKYNEMRLVTLPNLNNEICEMTKKRYKLLEELKLKTAKKKNSGN